MKFKINIFYNFLFYSIKIVSYLLKIFKKKEKIIMLKASIKKLYLLNSINTFSKARKDISSYICFIYNKKNIF